MGVRTVFVSSEKSDYNSELEVYYNAFNEIYISIYVPGGDAHESQYITLDKETAIKLAKTLRREISFIREEDSNG